MLYGFTGAHIDRVVGRGAGLTDEAFERKKQVVKQAVELHRPNPKDALDVLSKVGSLDIGGMAGVYLACAARRVPVVTDGLISNVAALTAMRLKPEAVQFMIPSHISFEPGAKLLKEITGLEPMLDMNMRLGEGTGAAIDLMKVLLKLVSEAEGVAAKVIATTDDLEDIAVIVLNHREINLTHPVLSACAEYGIGLYATGHNHQPSGVFLPFLQHSRTTRLMRKQLDIAKPLARLKKPKAVPRRSAGAVSATMVASKPWVIPMCKPHSEIPAHTLIQWSP